MFVHLIAFLCLCIFHMRFSFESKGLMAREKLRNKGIQGFKHQCCKLREWQIDIKLRESGWFGEVIYSWLFGNNL